FVLWFHYQVMNAGSRNLKYFDDLAWNAYLQMQTLAVLTGKRIADFYGQALDDLETQYKQWKDWIRTQPLKVIRAIANGLRQAGALLPDVRGYLLGMLKDASAILKQAGRDAMDWFQDLFSAVETLTDDIYLQNEYQNVKQFASKDLGVKGGDVAATEAFIGAVLGPVRVAQLQQLKTKPTPGFYTVPNTLFAYRLQ